MAIEYQIDWRDLTIFCLIVKLDDGKLPNGYYINDDTGKKCRWNLEHFLLNSDIKYDKSIMETIIKLSKSTKLQSRDLDFFKKILDNSNSLLIACIKQIESIILNLNANKRNSN